MLMRRNVAAGIGEYCRAALQRSDRKEPRYKWPTLLLLFRVKLCLVSFLSHSVKDCPKMRNLPKIFLRSFENMGPKDYILTSKRVLVSSKFYTCWRMTKAC